MPILSLVDTMICSGYEKEVNMFYSKEVQIARIDYRINLMRARDEMMNLKLIKALEREKRKLEKQ